ncbi:MAG: hypothetical protein CBC48_07035 [bacterium TMED88]|nr:MAG: hypothetical protein CBC48_07035 [bacterium TMED88]
MKMFHVYLAIHATTFQVYAWTKPFIRLFPSIAVGFDHTFVRNRVYLGAKYGGAIIWITKVETGHVHLPIIKHEQCFSKNII